MPGYVYALINPSYANQIKIGRTIHDPQDRANDIYSGDTGVPTEFQLAYFVEVSDPVKAEKSIHDTFKKERVNPRREFFAVSLTKAIPEMEKLKEQFPLTGEIAKPDESQPITHSANNQLYQVNLSISEHVILKRNKVNIPGTLALTEKRGLYFFTFTSDQESANFAIPFVALQEFDYAPASFKALRKEFDKFNSAHWFDELSLRFNALLSYDETTGKLNLTDDQRYEVFFEDTTIGQECFDQISEANYYLTHGIYSAFELASLTANDANKYQDPHLVFLSDRMIIYDYTDSNIKKIMDIASETYTQWPWTKHPFITLYPENLSDYEISANGTIAHVQGLQYKSTMMIWAIDELAPIEFNLRDSDEVDKFKANLNRLFFDADSINPSTARRETELDKLEPIMNILSQVPGFIWNNKGKLILLYIILNILF